jgi:YVTN family beta-propeller protein
MSARNCLIGSAALVSLLALGAPAQALEDLSHYVFVPNRESADIAIVDTDVDRVVGRVPVGRVPHQVAVSEITMKLVASNTADDTISIVDLRTLAPLATVRLDHQPEHMEVGPQGDILAVGNIAAGTVSLVSLVEDREIARVEGLYEPHNMTFSADGALLYVGNLGAGLVSVIDVASAAVVNEIPIGEMPGVASAGPADDEWQGVANVTRTPDGRLGFAAFGEGDAMAVLDLATQRTIKTLALGALPSRAYATGDGRYMITPNNGDRTISVVATASLEEVARLPGADDMTGVNSGWFESFAFVISRGEDKLVVLDLETLQPAGEIALPGAPETGVTTPDGRKLYVALSEADEVAVIDVQARAVVGRIGGVGDGPWGAHMAGAINYCH